MSLSPSLRRCPPAGPSAAPAGSSAAGSSSDAATDAATEVEYYNYMIELLDKDDEYQPAYSGGTGRGIVRETEHMNLVGGAARVAASVARHGPARHRVRIVNKMMVAADHVPDKGLPLPVLCLETYLMEKHKTIATNRSKMRERLAHDNREHGYEHPDVSLLDQPLNFQLNCKRSVGEKDHAAVTAAGIDYQHCTTTLCIYTKKEQEEVYEQIFTELGIEPIETVLVACAKPEEEEDGFKRVVFEIDSPFMKARELRVNYEEKDGWEVVSADTVTVGVNAVKDMAPEDKDLAAYLRVLLAACHPDRHVDLTAGEAHGLFKMIEGWTGRREEAVLLNKDEVKAHVATAVKWRDYMRQNEGATPSQAPTAALKSMEEMKAEKTLGQAMASWRTGQKPHPPQEARNVYLVVLREFPSFAAYCYGKAEKSHTNATKLNTLLRTGHGNQAARKAFPHLINFPSVCPACHTDRPEYTMLKGYLKGSNSETEAALLNGVEPLYAAWLRETHAAKVDDKKASKAKTDKKRREALHASGVVTKRAREE